MPEIDPIVKDYILTEIAKDKALIPFSNKRRLLRKVYRIGKAAFFGLPIFTLALSDLATEVALAGTKEMKKKVAFTPIVVLLPPPIVASGLAVYKIAKNKKLRQTAAVITNVAGLVYTLPCFVADHSLLYVFEKAVFGAPVPIMPNGRLRIIANETSDDFLAAIIRDAIEKYEEYND